MDNNILIISEKEQKAYLPYKYKDLEIIYESKNYSSFMEIIEKFYVLPLDSFKNSIFARFREAFNLIINKEHRSIMVALELAMELMLKAELNPIIIAACRSLDELDIYLDCLEENETDKFPCFEIKFEVAPQLSKTQLQEF